MTQDSGTGERIYTRLKAAVLAGSLTPHARLDFVELAEAFGVSTTPVREAAMRLLGEGLLEPHTKGGTRPVVASEMRLRALLDIHAKLSLAAVDWVVQPSDDARPEPSLDYEGRIRSFFRDHVQAGANPELVRIMERLSDQLAPFRHREPRLIADVDPELAALRGSRQSPVQLRRLLRAYHRRRAALVPQLVWMTNSDPYAGQ